MRQYLSSLFLFCLSSLLILLAIATLGCQQHAFANLSVVLQSQDLNTEKKKKTTTTKEKLAEKAGLYVESVARTELCTGR